VDKRPIFVSSRLWYGIGDMLSEVVIVYSNYKQSPLITLMT